MPLVFQFRIIDVLGVQHIINRTTPITLKEAKNVLEEMGCSREPKKLEFLGRVQSFEGNS